MIELVPVGPEDDADLRELLRIPMPGALSLGFEREPCFFLSAAVEGDRHQSGAYRDPKTQRVVAMGSNSSRIAYVNGEPRRLGYLSQIRIDPGFRARGLIRGIFQSLKVRHRPDDCPLYFTTIISDNKMAIRALERDLPEKPHYHLRTTLSTVALYTRWRARVPAVEGVRLRAGTSADLEGIASCLQRNYPRYQLAPRWTAEDLASPERCRDLAPQDFVVAERDGKIVGCAALWDQRGFKQTVVRGYPAAFLRPIVNAITTVVGLPRLPAIGETVPHAFLSHLAVDGDEVPIFLALAATLQVRSVARGLAFLALGLCEGHPFLAPARKAFRHFEYRANLYLCYFPDGEELARTLDGRVTHVELACL